MKLFDLLTESFDIGMRQASYDRHDENDDTNPTITPHIDSRIEVSQFIEILKKFLPLAQKIVKLQKMPTIILKNTLSYDSQPTMGRFNNENYTLELAVANRQPVDILRTLAHELTHARQDAEHIEIDPTTGSHEENEANVVAGIVMRHFNKKYPEYLSYQPVDEGKSHGRERFC